MNIEGSAREMNKVQRYIMSRLNIYGEDETGINYFGNGLSWKEFDVVQIVCCNRTGPEQTLAESICTKFPWSDDREYRGPRSGW